MKRNLRGFTLIELVIAIVVIGIAVTGILTVMNETTAHSADPMIEHQEIAVAQAYLEEILSKSYTTQPGAGSRKNFDDVDDYNGLHDPQATNELGQTIAGLKGYAVDVTVTDNATLGTINTAKQVDVTVTGPNGTTIMLTGYRTDY